MAGIAEAAESIGFHTLPVSLDFLTLKNEVPLPCVAHWRQRHFVIIYKITKTHVYIADPGYGLVSYGIREFIEGWIEKGAHEHSEGFLLLLETTPRFYENGDEQESRVGFSFLTSYIKPYSKYVFN